uniref:Uncharacterized protein n=1 Tax=Anguilla anguilla TaxID=7936 RepID=A0A0E9R7G5_ANGAN
MTELRHGVPGETFLGWKSLCKVGKTPSRRSGENPALLG